MSRPTCPRRRVFWVLLLAGLPGCTGGLLQSDVPVAETYRLGTNVAAPAAIAASATETRLALTVARPRATPAIDTDRIAVVPGTSRFDYYSDVRWAETAPQMLQQNLVTALDASGRFAGVFAAPARVPAELMLDVELRHFEAVIGPAGAAPTVRVQVQANLIDSRRAARVTSFVSEAQVAAAETRRPAIVAAFERANAEVIADVVQRVGAAAAAIPLATH